jgi:hypothetical protein
MPAGRFLARLALLLLAALSAASTGCLLAVAGAAGAGAAAAGYFYLNGLLYRDYPASLGDSIAAVRTALTELGFPVVKEDVDTGTATVQTRTGDGSTVRIHLDVIPSRIPVEGPLTRIGVRVGFSGDETVSARILDQVSRHLAPAALVPPPGAAPAAPAILPPRPAPAETAAPPLAPVPIAATAASKSGPKP